MAYAAAWSKNFPPISPLNNKALERDTSLTYDEIAIPLRDVRFNKYARGGWGYHEDQHMLVIGKRLMLYLLRCSVFNSAQLKPAGSDRHHSFVDDAPRQSEAARGSSSSRVR